MFQQAINITQAIGVEGDFASEDPRWSLPSVEGGFKAGGTQGATPPANAGVFIARFVWADVATNTLVLNTGSGAPSGFLHRDMNGLNLNYFSTPGATSFFIPAGFPVGEVFSGGTFFVRNTGAGPVAVGQKAFAKNAHTSGAAMDGGTIQFGATGATIAGFTETKWWATTPALAGELVKMSSQPLG
jgi:hypothetical protein